MANRVRADLEKLSKNWKDTEPVEGFFNLPGGEHEVKIVHVEIGYSKNDRLQIVYEMEVLSGEFKGKTVKKFAGLDNADSIGYAKGDLKKINVSIPDDIGDLPEVLDKEVVDLCILVEAKSTKKAETTYQNLYFQRVLEADEVESITDKDNDNEAEEKTTSKRRVVKEEEEEEEEEEEKEKISYKNKNVSYKDGKKVVIGKALTEPDKQGEIDIRVGSEIWTVPADECEIVEVEEKEKEEEEPTPRRRAR